LLKVCSELEQPAEPSVSVSLKLVTSTIAIAAKRAEYFRAMLPTKIVAVLIVCLVAVSSDFGGYKYSADFSANVSIGDPSIRKLSAGDDSKAKCLIVTYDKIKGHLNWMQVVESPCFKTYMFADNMCHLSCSGLVFEISDDTLQTFGHHN
jgi:hypothetical protein